MSEMERFVLGVTSGGLIMLIMIVAYWISHVRTKLFLLETWIDLLKNRCDDISEHTDYNYEALARAMIKEVKHELEKKESKNENA